MGGFALCFHLCVADALGADISREDRTREALATLFNAKVGVREVGFNAGPEVEAFQRSSGNHKGQPWCASFVTWCFKMLGLKTPVGSGAARAWFPADKVIYRRGGLPSQPIKKGDCVGYRYATGIHHVGFVERWNDDFVMTVEGNTGGQGGVDREGDGVRRMRRLKVQISIVSSWVPKS